MMAGTDDKHRAAEVLAKIEKAHKHVCDLAAGRERWTMRIPARPDMDSDLMIGDALDSARKLIESVAPSAEQRGEPRQYKHKWVPYPMGEYCAHCQVLRNLDGSGDDGFCGGAVYASLESSTRSHELHTDAESPRPNHAHSGKPGQASVVSAPLEDAPRELWLAKGRVSGYWEHLSMREPTVEGWQRYVREDCAHSHEGNSKTANPERRSSLEHSEVKPDGNEGRSGEVDREGGGSTATARGDAVGAGSSECGPRPSGREADREDLNADGGAVSAPSATASSPPAGYTLVETELFNEICRALTPEQQRGICIAEGSRWFKKAGAT